MWGIWQPLDLETLLPSASPEARFRWNQWLTNVYKTDKARNGVVTVDAAYTVVDSVEMVLANSSGGNVPITLPSAVGRMGREITVKKIHASNVVTVITEGGNIDNTSVVSLASVMAVITLKSDEINWWIKSLT